MAIVQRIKTYVCPTCDWHYDADPSSDYYQTRFLVQTPSGIELKGIPSGKCASCYARGSSIDLEVASDPEDQSTHTTVEEAEVDALQVSDKDENGQRVMVDSGSTMFKLDLNTGEVSEIPVMVERMRSLTDEEKAQTLEQAKKTVDDLSKKEVS